MERTADPSALLSVRNLSVSFSDAAGTLHAVDNVSFDVRDGEVFGIVGESGSGKTVSLMSIMGMIESSGMKISGEALFRGRDLLRLSPAELSKIRGREIGFVFQNPLSSLNPVMKIGAQIAEAPVFHGLIGRRQAKEFAIHMLELVGIENPQKRVNDYPHQFSGGMRQRAMIAMALICSPKILIADEPTTALDVTIQAQILELMKELQKKENTSIIFITHNLGVVAEICDRVSVMYAGHIVEQGPVNDIFYNPQHPYTKGLLVFNHFHIRFSIVTILSF